MDCSMYQDVYPSEYGLLSNADFNLISPHLLGRLEVDWVSLRSSFVILPPHFDGLVRLTCD